MGGWEGGTGNGHFKVGGVSADLSIEPSERKFSGVNECCC